MVDFFKIIRAFKHAIHCIFFAVSPTSVERHQKRMPFLSITQKKSATFIIVFQYKQTQFPFCALFLVFSSCFTNTINAQQPKDWISIFNGKDFTGWTIEEKPANFSVKDSAFVLKMTNGSTRHAFVRTNKEYQDFILELDCKRDENFDSGIVLRGIIMPKEAPIALNGYMIKIDPSPTRLWTGGIFMDFGNKSEWLYNLADDKRAQQAEKVAQWNHYRVEAIGQHIKVWINGIPTVNMIDGRYAKGYIAFKIHRLKEITPKWNEQMEAHFKNVKIISVKPNRFEKVIDIPVKQTTAAWQQLFNGKDLTRFSTIGGAGKISVQDGAIVLNRTANTKEHTFLRTDKAYKDFILELDAKRDPSFNYGILFRAMKAADTASVRLYGYQVKIDHTSRHWTGAIFDDFGTTWNWISNLENNPIAQNAEKPTGEWNHWRIEAVGTNIKVWLNGVLTTNINNSKYKEGCVALKIHFLGNNPAMEKPTAWFKNIQIIDKNVEVYTLKN